MSVWPFAIVYLVPLSVAAGYLVGGWFTFTTPVFVFGIVPVLDIVIGTDTRNPSPQEEGLLNGRDVFRWLTMGCAPLQVAVGFWGLFVLSAAEMTPVETIGFVLSVGISSGVMGINVAHELAHRVNRRLEPALAAGMLWTVFYMHWGLEHVVGHHRYVATPDDPATARKGESVYAFWKRSVTGAFNRAWDFEAKRMMHRNRPTWSWHNRCVRYLLAQLLLLLGIALGFGWRGVLYWVAQAIIAFSLLEIVNYIEHYGLLRQKKDNGQYEPIKPWHSWNSSNWLTNRFLFNLQRHSDHHYKPGRRYQLLRHFDESPQLPTGYAGMILIAMFPPLWRWIMDQRVDALVSRR